MSKSLQVRRTSSAVLGFFSAISFPWGLMSFRVLMPPVPVCKLGVVIPQLGKTLGVTARRMKLSEHSRSSVEARLSSPFMYSCCFPNLLICSLEKKLLEFQGRSGVVHNGGANVSLLCSFDVARSAPLSAFLICWC